MTEQVCALLKEAGLTVNESVIGALVERHSDRDVLAAAETAATWAVDSEVRTRNGTALFKAAIERAPQRPAAGKVDWRAFVRAELPEITEQWPPAVDVLATRAAFAAAGGWQVTAEMLREFYDRHWRGHVEAVHAAQPKREECHGGT